MNLKGNGFCCRNLSNFWQSLTARPIADGVEKGCQHLSTSCQSTWFSICAFVSFVRAENMLSICSDCVLFVEPLRLAIWPFLCSALPCGWTENLLSDAVLGAFLLDHLGFGTWPLLCSTLPCGGTENLRIGYYALSDTILCLGPFYVYRVIHGRCRFGPTTPEYICIILAISCQRKSALLAPVSASSSASAPARNE